MCNLLAEGGSTTFRVSSQANEATDAGFEDNLRHKQGVRWGEGSLKKERTYNRREGTKKPAEAGHSEARKALSLSNQTGLNGLNGNPLALNLA
jgi:hypothetical protein